MAKKNNIFLYEDPWFVSCNQHSQHKEYVLSHPFFTPPHGFYMNPWILVQCAWNKNQDEIPQRTKIFHPDFFKKDIFYNNNNHHDHNHERKIPMTWKDVVFLNQVHGPEVLDIDIQGVFANPWKTPGDGLVGTKQALGVVTADCVPFLLHNTENNKVGALHGGWKGCVQGILTEGLKKIINSEKYSLVLPLHVLIGPSIGPRNYQVSKDVVEALQKQQRKHDELWNIKTHNEWFFQYCDDYYVDLGFYGQCLLRPLVSELFVLQGDTYNSPYSHRYAMVEKKEHYFLMQSVIFPHDIF